MFSDLKRNLKEEEEEECFLAQIAHGKVPFPNFFYSSFIYFELYILGKID